MAERERFTFDDEETSEVEKIEPVPTKIDDVSVGDLDNTVDEGAMAKKKKKFKLKKWQIVLITFLVIIIIGVSYIFMATRNNGPVLGDRCASLLSMDQNKFEDVRTQIKTDYPAVSEIEIKVECRMIKMTLSFVDNTPAPDAKNIAIASLHKLDDSMGAIKEEGAEYSQLFGHANGRGQYNVSFLLTSNGDTAFPVFGTKHPSSNEIFFTDANVKDQATTDKVNEKKAQKDAGTQ